jgi:formylmethanofuran dehydrogenase subunit E
MPTLEALLEVTAARHAHLCPKQVLGVQMGLLAGTLLGVDVPQCDKRLLVIMETDGCVADGVEVATGCSVGHRTLRVEDFGKVAATFVDTVAERALRIVPHPEARSRATAYAVHIQGRWKQQLRGYQCMPDELLLSWHKVCLLTSVAALVSRPHVRSICQDCGEEIINEREVARDGRILCRGCAGYSYYRTLSGGSPLPAHNGQSYVELAPPGQECLIGQSV